MQITFSVNKKVDSFRSDLLLNSKKYKANGQSFLQSDSWEWYGDKR